MRETNFGLKVAILVVCSLLILLGVYSIGESVGKGDGYSEGYTWGYKYGTEDGLKIGFDKAVQKAQTPPNYLLHDPTLAEAIKFLKDDKTDEKEFSELNFNCANFATEVINNAKKQGIRGGTVWMNMTEDKGHTIIVFHTTDKGDVYFEPQLDIPVQKPKFGEQYLRKLYIIESVVISW